MTIDCPGLTVPSAQGKLLHPPPLTPAGVTPAGVGSETKVFAAASAPEFVTVMVYDTVVPTTADGGPLLVMPRSACAATVVGTVAKLLLVFGSFPEVTKAVVVMSGAE